MQAVEKTIDLKVREKSVGTRLRRTEDQKLLTGNDAFIDNIKFQGMIFAGFLRSPYAHARIKRIDFTKIIDNPMLVAILTPEKVKKNSKPVPVIWRPPFSKIHEHYALAQSKVLHVGDPVVAIAVKNRDALEDLLDLIEIDYEEIEAVLDPLTVEGRPPIHEELGTNTCLEIPISKGDVEKALESAEVFVSSRFELPRVSASPMETRGVIAFQNKQRGVLEIYSSTQWPHMLRTLLAGCLDLSENRLRVIAPDVGGGFGVKGEVYGEEIAVSLLALETGLPVKWIESRKESFLATTHSRAQTLDAKASFTKEGKITGLKVSLVCDFGA